MTSRVNIPKNTQGMLSSLQFSFTFLQWAQSLSVPMTVAHIVDRFEVSRATAYRWKAAWEAFIAREAA